MARTHQMQRSFAGGKLSEDMLGRIDNEKYPVGCAELKNFIAMPQGPARNRAGLTFILEVPDSTEACRIVPFQFSNDQAYIVMLNGERVSFSTDGGAVVSAAQIIVSIALSATCELEITGHGRSEGDVVYVNGVDDFDRYAYKVGAVIDVDNFYLLHMDGTAVDSSAFAAYVSGGTVNAVYTVDMTYTEDELFDIGYAQSADVLTLTHNEHPAAELSRLGAASWSLDDIAFEPVIASPTGVGAVESTAQSGVDYSYVVTAIAQDGLEESLPSASADINSNLTVANQYITISWTGVSGALRYNVYKDYRGGLYGFIGATEGLSFKDDNITPDVSVTPPSANDPFDAPDKYPRTVCYFEQRRGFANTNERPTTVWLTRSGTESNMTSSIPSQADDAIQIRAAARELNAVMHLVPMSDLLMLTSSGNWMLSSGRDEALTPSNISPREQAHDGASRVHPALAANAAMYAQAVGGHLKSVTLSQDTSGGYVTDDMCVLAADLFDGYDIVDLAYSSAPLQIVWVVRSDGTLLGMTYYPEHKVFGWHEHTTDGLFESIAVIREGEEDVLYAIVNRNIDGRTCRYLERMHSRKDVALELGVFADSAHIYDGSATSSITGLWHLEGEEVDVLADGASLVRTVANGQITLDVPAEHVIVGLPYTSRLTSMPLVLDSVRAPAGAVGLKKKIDQLLVRLKHSSVVSGGVTGGAENLREMAARSTEPYGTPPALKNGVFEIPVDGEWGYDAQFIIEHRAPLPCQVTAVLAMVTVAEV